MEQPNQVKGKLAPTTPPINYPTPRILQMDAVVGGAAGAVALATLAEKNEEKGARDENLKQLQILDWWGKRARDRGQYSEGGPRGLNRRGAERQPSNARRQSRPSGADVRPRPSRRRRTTPASTTTRLRVAGAAIPPRPRPSPTRPMSTTTRRRRTTPASTTTKSRAVGAAVPPRPRPSPTRPMSTTTRPRMAGAVVPRPSPTRLASTMTRTRAAGAAIPP